MCVTSKDWAEKVGQGQVTEDLYYQANREAVKTLRKGSEVHDTQGMAGQKK